MDALKKIWPFSFETKSLGNLILKIVVYILCAAVLGVLLGFLGGIKVLGPILWVISTIVWVYVLAGIVLTILDYIKVLK